MDGQTKPQQDRMVQRRRRRLRKIIVMLHDAFCGVGSYLFAAVIIVPLNQFVADISAIIPTAIFAGVLSVVISSFLGVFSTRWRLASLIDFVALIQSATILMIALFILHAVYHFNYSAPLIVAELRIIFLGSIFVLCSQAAGRIASRYYFFKRREVAKAASSEACIFIGSTSEAENALHATDQGILALNIVACLVRARTPSEKYIRGRPVLGSVDSLERAFNTIAAGEQTVTSLLLGPSILQDIPLAQQIKRTARRLALTLLKIETVGLGGRSEIRFEDFLFRARRYIDNQIIDNFVSRKSILITGGGGSIGGDIALRAAAHGASKIILLDISELGLQTRAAQFRQEAPQSQVELVICDVRDSERLIKVVAQIRPDIMIHAAALKHVDLVEQNWEEAIRTNVFGTLNALKAADHVGVKTFVNISTDKAVDPVSMLGFSKRAAEFLVAHCAARSVHRRYSVRFGNVLGSSGSVVEVFLAQITAGGPVTLTDPRVMRYFMSREEAAGLVLATGLLRDRAGLYVLDMGEPISIRNLAIELIEWAGLEPETDIKIIHTGLRPGERIAEKMVDAYENLDLTSMSGVNSVHRSLEIPALDLDMLARALARNDKIVARQILAFEGSLAQKESRFVGGADVG